MSKTILRSLLLALAGVIASDLRAAPAWTTGSCTPSEWTALGGNLLAGQTGTTVGNLSYLANHVASLTDGAVPDPVAAEGLCGFCNGTTIKWEFDAPKTLEKIRLSSQTYWSGKQYHRINVTKIEVQRTNGGVWESIDAPALNYSSDTAEGNVPSATLENAETGVLTEGVVALMLSFATDGTYAYYCAEIEAVGFSEATGPVVDSFDIAPAKTKATVSGSIADPGTDATACDVYLALDGGASTKIAEGATGSFEYRIQGLTAGTTYAYELSVSNNAAAAKGTARTGTFTTLAADAQTASWTQEDVVPGDWSALANNVLAEKVGAKTAGAIAGTNYATDDSSVLTDGAVPSAGGSAYIYGYQNGCTMEWTLDNAVTLECLRLSAAYLAGTAYSKLAVSSVSVKTSGSDEWTALDAPAFSDISGRSSGVLICATLSDVETGVLAENVVGIRIVFGNVNALGSYVAEIEAVGHAEGKPGKMVIFVH